MPEPEQCGVAEVFSRAPPLLEHRAAEEAKWVQRPPGPWWGSDGHKECPLSLWFHSPKKRQVSMQKKQGVVFLWGFAGALLVPRSLPKAVRGLHSTSHSLGTLVHVLQELGADGDKQEEEKSNQLW